MSGEVNERRGRAALVVPAGGTGRRMGGEGAGVRKQYLELLGEPILLHAIRPFLEHPEIRWIVIALPAEDLADPPRWLTELDPRISLVAGGEERGDSVRLALEALPREAELVLVHDAARPLITRQVIDRVLRAAESGVGAVAAIPLADTPKEVDDEGRITNTPDRSRLWRAQTPQGFPRRLLLEAARRAATDGYQGTDDASLVEHYGGQVIVVEGAPENLKVTTPADLVIAEAYLRTRLGDGPLADPAPERRSSETSPPSAGGATVIPFRSATDQEREAPRVAAHLRAGGLIAYPTETVYGIGSALQPAALERLAALKGRAIEDPFLLLVEDPEELDGVHWTESALRLAAAFWPGPLTLVVGAEADHFPERVIGPDDTIAIRSSPHTAVRAVLGALGAPMTSTSANRVGDPPATSAAGVLERWVELGEPADLWILDGGPLPPSAPSTIIDCTRPRPRLLREGAIPLTSLAGAVGYIDGVGPEGEKIADTLPER